MFYSFIIIFRPINLAIAVLSVGLGAYFSLGNTSFFSSSEFYFTCFAVACILAGGNIWNDVCDLQIDKINKPGKVYIPKILSRSSAVWIYVFLSGFGIYFSLMTKNSSVIYLSFLAIILLWTYSKFFKRMILIGNVVVSFLSALTIFCGGILFGLNEKIYWVIIFAFLISLIREIVKDIEDKDGDEKCGAKTFAVKYGVVASKKISIVLGLILIVLVGILWLKWNLNYFLVSVFLVQFPILILIFLLKKSETRKDFSRASLILKWIMLGGMGAMLFL